MTDLRYPVGQCIKQSELNKDQHQQFIGEIAETPAKLRAAVNALSPTQLDTPYRPDGWTVRQVVHHLPDSHLNSYTRFKLALTEEAPAIKTYDEAAWAELSDAKTAPIEISLSLLTALHARWIKLLRSLDEAHLKRTVRHPEWGEISLDW